MFMKYLYEEFEGFVVEVSLAELGRQTECWDLGEAFISLQLSRWS